MNIFNPQIINDIDNRVDYLVASIICVQSTVDRGKNKITTIIIYQKHLSLKVLVYPCPILLSNLNLINLQKTNMFIKKYCLHSEL